MKLILILTLVLNINTLYAKVSYTPLDIEPGLWEYSFEKFDPLKDMLAKIPKAQHAMIKKMMAGKFKSITKPKQQCLTKDQIKDPNFMAGDRKEKCTIKATKSTSKHFSGTVQCEGSALTTNISFNMLSRKKNISKVNVNTGGKTKEIITKGKWLSSKCPK